MPPTGAPTKPALRAQMRRFLEALPPEQERAWSGAICRRVMDEHLIPPGAAVMLYAPSPRLHEVDLGHLADRLAAGGCRLAVPVTDWAAKTITPVQVSNLHADLVPDAKPGATGIRTPRPGLPALRPEDVHAVILPGLAFDAHGGRLGRGAGFYDRFLATLSPTTRTIALGFEAQIVERVPTEPHDRPVDILVTEARTIRVTPTGTPPASAPS